MPEYAATPTGEVRRALAAGSFPIPNDPEKLVAALISAAETQPALLRVPLGPDTFDEVRADLTGRLAEHLRHEVTARAVAAGAAA